MNEYVCKYCGLDLSKRKKRVKICSGCSWKNKYFDGLYWIVLKRDNYSCSECGKSGHNKKRVVNVHHKNHEHRDNRLENLETLCINCHARKRKAFCKMCMIGFIARNPRQAWCEKCGVKRRNMTSWKAQMRYWKKRGDIRWKWYKKRLEDPNYCKYKK